MPSERPRGARLRPAADDAAPDVARTLRQYRRQQRRDDWDDSPPYIALTRRPWPCLLLVLPLLMIYEVGVLALGGPQADVWRTGADAWMRRGLLSLGIQGPWMLPGGLVLGLLLWQTLDRRPGRPTVAVVGLMALESLVWAVALLGLGKGFEGAYDWLERLTAPPSLQVTPGGGRSMGALLVGFVGAGIYEETLFRLALLPMLFGVFRLTAADRVSSWTMAALVGSLLFALAHHAGGLGEPFTWYAFAFRAAAGLAFGLLFAARGFGIAVGAHIAYDGMVGGLGWHF